MVRLADGRAARTSNSIAPRRYVVSDAPLAEWREYYLRMAALIEWQMDVETWRGSVETRLEGLEAVTDLIPEILERLGPQTRILLDNYSVLQHQALPHFLCFSRHLLYEWFAPSFIISNLAQRFAVLLTFPDGPSRVAEGKDRENRDVLGNAQQGIDLRQVVKANPV